MSYHKCTAHRYLFRYLLLAVQVSFPTINSHWIGDIPIQWLLLFCALLTGGSNFPHIMAQTSAKLGNFYTDFRLSHLFIPKGPFSNRSSRLTNLALSLLNLISKLDEFISGITTDARLYFLNFQYISSPLL